MASTGRSSNTPLLIGAFHHLEIQNIWNGSTWDETFFVYEAPFSNRDGSTHVRREIVEIVNDQGIYSVAYIDDRGTKAHISSFQVSNLSVTVEVMEGVKCPEVPFDIKQCHYLDSFNFYSIRNLNINLAKYPCASSIDLDEWRQFVEIKSRLNHFSLRTAAYCDFNKNALNGCDQLRDLEVPFHIGTEIIAYENLERLTMPGISSLFAHQMAYLPELIEINELPSLYNNQFETLHAERYFELLLGYKLEASLFEKTRLGKIEAAVKKDLPNKWTTHGEVLVFENELLGYGPGSINNDTLVHGQMKKGKRKGIWTYKFADQYWLGDMETHHVNYNRKQKMKLPKNGVWKLNYANKSTAIEGTFTNRLKVGEWRFYNEDGNLRTTRFYENDTLKRSIVQQTIDGIFFEWRTYYFSAEACVQSFLIGSKLSFNYVDLSDERDPIIIDVHHFNILNESKTGYQKIRKGTAEYEAAVRKHFINYLYPELKDAAIPYSF